MTERKISQGVTELVAAEGMWLHRRGTEMYARRAAVASGETGDWEETGDRPPYTREEYAREVERLIGLRYTTGQEIQFAREGEAAGEKFGEYLRYVELCKTQAKEGLEARKSIR